MTSDTLPTMLLDTIFHSTGSDFCVSPLGEVHEEGIGVNLQSGGAVHVNLATLASGGGTVGEKPRPAIAKDLGGICLAPQPARLGGEVT